MDGWVEFYFDPNAQTGKGTNRVKTMPGKAWITYFRVYSRPKRILDRSCVRPEIEKAIRTRIASQRLSEADNAPSRNRGVERLLP